jgi:D-glycero-beta-D-manno-heptose 1-phosphate adenylyltransferase
MNSHLHADLMHSRLAEIELGAERYRREANMASQPRRFARIQGSRRTLLSEEERGGAALALEAVDAVTFFDEDTPRELIAQVLPDILVKGADWSHFVAGREEVEAAGGKVVLIPLEPGHSTTNIEKEILAR